MTAPFYYQFINKDIHKIGHILKLEFNLIQGRIVNTALCTLKVMIYSASKCSLTAKVTNPRTGILTSSCSIGRKRLGKLGLTL